MNTSVGIMRKIFREAHREPRLKPQLGHDTSFEVRPLSLTPASSKFIRVKDVHPPKSDEPKQ